MTERIMLAIREHLEQGERGGGPTHHYNRAWEKVHKILEEDIVAEVPLQRDVAASRADRAFSGQCGKLLARAGSIRRCTLFRHHEGKCAT